MVAVAEEELGVRWGVVGHGCGGEQAGLLCMRAGLDHR